MKTISRIAAGTVIVLALVLGAKAAGRLLPASTAPASDRVASAALQDQVGGRQAPAAQPSPAPARPGRAGPLGVSAVRPASSTVDSFNSAGYAVSRAHTRFRFVRATFFVPYLNCRLSRSARSADWVGLDGFVGTPDSVEQDGIAANCSAGGRAAYHAWYAMFPRGRTTLRLSVKAGNSVTASVFFNRATGVFSLSVVNNTTGGHVEVHATCPSGVSCPHNSAEIISSTTTSGSGSKLKVTPLADYGAASFTSIAITDRSGARGSVRSAHWGAARIVETERVAPFRVIARPTLVQGATFDNYWTRAS